MQRIRVKTTDLILCGSRQNLEKPGHGAITLVATSFVARISKMSLEEFSTSVFVIAKDSQKF